MELETVETVIWKWRVVRVVRLTSYVIRLERLEDQFAALSV